MKNYPLKANKADWRVLQPQDTFNTEEYTAEHYDLYLTTEYIKDEHNSARRYYRLHANRPHTIEMALAYNVKCPVCGGNVMKQVGRCRDYHTLGLYECPVCDRRK